MFTFFRTGGRHWHLHDNVHVAAFLFLPKEPWFVQHTTFCFVQVGSLHPLRTCLPIVLTG